MFYIKREAGKKSEIMERFATRGGAIEKIKKCRLHDPSAEYYISTHNGKNWRV